MKQTLTPFGIVILFAVVLNFICWGVLTRFGRYNGIHIEQKVEVDQLMDSTYSVSTYLYFSPHFPFYGEGRIEWSDYATVKCYNVEKAKISQYKNAVLVKNKLVEFKKKQLSCKPQ